MFYTAQISEGSRHSGRPTAPCGWKMAEDRRSNFAAPVQPGEYWLIEQPLGKELSSLDRGALNSADIVIYDHPLAALVAQILPMGRYAEPLFHNGEAQLAVLP